MDIKNNVPNNWKIHILFKHTKDIYLQKKKKKTKHQQILRIIITQIGFSDHNQLTGKQLHTHTHTLFKNNLKNIFAS